MMPKPTGKDSQPIMPKSFVRVSEGTNIMCQATELEKPQTLALMPLTSPRLIGVGALGAGKDGPMLNEGQQRLINLPLIQSECAQAVPQAAANNTTSDITVGLLARSRAVGMTARAATEEEETQQRLN